MTEFLSKFGEQKLVMVNYACGFNQSETGKYFEGIIIMVITAYVQVRTLKSEHFVNKKEKIPMRCKPVHGTISPQNILGLGGLLLY